MLRSGSHAPAGQLCLSCLAITWCMQLGNPLTLACIVQAMLQRSQQNGVARVRWETLPSCQLVAVASGTAEAASNAETSVTQLVQAFNIRAQVIVQCGCQEHHPGSSTVDRDSVYWLVCRGARSSAQGVPSEL